MKNETTCKTMIMIKNLETGEFVGARAFSGETLKAKWEAARKHAGLYVAAGTRIKLEAGCRSCRTTAL